MTTEFVCGWVGWCGAVWCGEGRPGSARFSSRSTDCQEVLARCFTRRLHCDGMTCILSACVAAFLGHDMGGINVTLGGL